MPPEDARQLAESWFAKAESDFRIVALALPGPDCPFDLVCFHAQQAAEKYLKGLLSFYGIEFPRTHDLEDLAERIPNHVGLTLNADELDELSHLAVVPRYPGLDEEIDLEMAEQMVEIAKRIKMAVLAILGRDEFENKK